MAPAFAPDSSTPVPEEMRQLAGGPVTLVWENQVGGLTGRVDTEPARFIKWNPLGSGESLAAEAERLDWLASRHLSPAVVDLVTADDAELLVTLALPGRSAVDPVWLARPNEAIRAIAVGLRALHGLPVAECPFEWSVASRVAVAAAAGKSPPATLGAEPEVDEFVVCHADPCAPNTLVGDDAAFVGNVDFGRLGVADRWADLAVATMSFGWNYHDYDEWVFWEAYGAEPDAERIAFYRELWNAT